MIAVTGPESCGKTTLTRALAAHFRTLWAPEFARHYLPYLPEAYTEADLLTMARGQMALEDALVNETQEIIFCDTGMLVFKVWSEVKYRRCHPDIMAALRQKRYRFHLLCAPDIAWQADPLRENRDERNLIFEQYRTYLATENLPFAVISGHGNARVAAAIRAVKLFF